MSVNMRGQMEDVSSLNTLLTVNIFLSSFSFARTAQRMCGENFCLGLLHDAATGVWIESDVR